MKALNTKDDRERSIEQTKIADLTVNENTAAEVKGGPHRAGDGGGGDVVVFDIIESCP